MISLPAATTTRNTVAKRSGPKFYVTYGYDLAGNLTLQTDHLSTSIFTRPLPTTRTIGRPTMTDAAGGVTAMKYDEVGNLMPRWDPRGGWRPQQHRIGTQYVYDGLNRLIAKTDPTGAVGGTTLYTYDQVGNLLTEPDRWERPTSRRTPMTRSIASRR